jgi:hypothetical protein
VETFWTRFKSGLLEGAVTVAERAEHLSYIGRIRLDIANDKRLLRASLAEAGRRVYELLSENADAEVSKDAAVLELLGRIREQEAILREREASLASMMRAGASPSPPPEES